MTIKKRVLEAPNRPLTGTIKVPGDKSISHRSIILGSLAEGETKVTNFLTSDDCFHTMKAFQQLGVAIENEGTDLLIRSDGYLSFHKSEEPLYFGNSGTTARLMIGLLSGLPLTSIIKGDAYLSKRPMDRVVEPLRKMGATIEGDEKGHHLPLTILGTSLKGIYYELPVKSAQVKSALLLAGLLADGTTTIIEKTPTRNHTENMLQAFGANIQVNGEKITIDRSSKLHGTDVFVPGDISSAAFFLIGAAIVPESQITIENVGLNETRTGILDVLKAMGATLKIDHIKEVSGEQFGQLTITSSNLHGTTIEGDLIPRLIDEIPIIALLATQAEGKTIIKDAEELRVKETDRIHAVVDVLSKLGADIEETADGMNITGPTPLYGAEVSAYYDHRMAMMITIASLIAKGKVILDDDESISISYPQFFEDLHKLLGLGDEN